MTAMITIFKRECGHYFSSPIAYVLIFLFLVLANICTFILGGFYEREQADLLSFFDFHPWLYLLIVPAIAMRTWSEEHKSGSFELLMTLPIKTSHIMYGKFLAAWVLLGLSLFLTFPLWLTVNYLGDPDNGTILSTYIGSWLMSGAFLAIGMCMSATTSNQVISFVLTSVICFIFVFAGSPMFLNLIEGFLPNMILDAIASLSFLTHFRDLAKGVIGLDNVVYYSLSIVAWLYAAYIVIEHKKTR